MSTFITKPDYVTRLHTEILNAVTRDNDDVLDAVELQTIATMTTYLSRYDCAAIFAATGNSRNKHILKLALHISIYEILKLANPKALTETIKYDYEEALKWLEGVGSGKFNPGDLPTLDDEDGTDINKPLKWGSWAQNSIDY